MFGIAAKSAIALAGVVLSTATFADDLPKTAAPMSGDAVRKLYSGNSAISKNSDIFFEPDGSLKGIFGKPKVTDTIVGSRSVSGNEICLYTFRRKEPNSLRDCYQYWIDKKRTLTLWSIHGDGSAADQSDGYYVGEESNLKPGDLVSSEYAAAPGP